ncbi:MAG: PaREP1 family protein, partial [Mariprofundales bacterium]|nr:PaREP1 family protein [Mariprofundales bacterium]
MSVLIALPRGIVERARREAERLGLGLEEYLVELLVQSFDPEDRAVEYIEAARGLLERAREELGRGDVRQAAEKVWGAAALAVKAYAWLREG